MDNSPATTYSISVRLQRTTSEFAFVKVPVTNDLIVRQPDGTGRIDTVKMMQRAIELGEQIGLAWTIEDQQIQPHPLQTPPP